MNEIENLKRMYPSLASQIDEFANKGYSFEDIRDAAIVKDLKSQYPASSQEIDKVYNRDNWTPKEIINELNVQGAKRSGKPLAFPEIQKPISQPPPTVTPTIESLNQPESLYPEATTSAIKPSVPQEPIQGPAQEIPDVSKIGIDQLTGGPTFTPDYIQSMAGKQKDLRSSPVLTQMFLNSFAKGVTLGLIDKKQDILRNLDISTADMKLLADDKARLVEFVGDLSGMLIPGGAYFKLGKAALMGTKAWKTATPLVKGIMEGVTAMTAWGVDEEAVRVGKGDKFDPVRIAEMATIGALFPLGARAFGKLAEFLKQFKGVPIPEWLRGKVSKDVAMEAQRMGQFEVTPEKVAAELDKTLDEGMARDLTNKLPKNPMTGEPIKPISAEEAAGIATTVAGREAKPYDWNKTELEQWEWERIDEAVRKFDKRYPLLKEPTVRVSRNKPIETPEPPSAIDTTLTEIKLKNNAELSRQKQAGTWTFAEGKPLANYKSTDPGFERILTATFPKPEGWIKENITEPLKKIGQDLFSFEGTLKEFPELQNDARLMKDLPIRGGRKGLDVVASVVSPLNPKTEFPIFQRLIALRDFLETAQRGELTPVAGLPMIASKFEESFKNALDPAAKDMIEKQWAMDAVPYIENEIASLTAYGNSIGFDVMPKVNSALLDNDKIINALRDELIKRGKLTPEVQEGGVAPFTFGTRENYAPHRVLDYALDWAPGLPKRVRPPYRWYTKKRIGSLKDIDTDYIGNMQNYVASIYTHNGIDDFITKVADKYDLWSKLSKEERLRLFGQKGVDDKGNIVYNKPNISDYKTAVTIDGKPYKAIQLDKGNYNYVASSIPERMINEMIEEETISIASEDIRQVLAIGRKKPFYLLPENIADRLIDFRKKTWGDNSTFWRGARKLTSVWKRIVLDAAGLPFQVNNLVGDMINLYREDPKSFTKLYDSARLLWRDWNKTTDAADEKLLQFMQDQAIYGGTTFTAGEAGKILADPRLYKYRGWKGYFGLSGKYNPINWIETFSEYRERFLRTASVLKNLERLDKGEPFITKTVDIGGLQPLDAIGKIGREALVDYGKITPQFASSIRGLLFPFATFYVENAKGWAKYIKRNPGNFAWKFLPPLVGINVYNYTFFPEHEKNLAPYYYIIPHIWIPDPDKLYKEHKWEPLMYKGRAVMIGLQTPVDMAFRLFPGFGALQETIRDVQFTHKSAKQLAKEFALNVPGIPAEQALKLVNPIATAVMDYKANKDSFTKKEIIDPKSGKWDASKQGAEWLATKLISPYAQYLRSQELSETFVPEGLTTLPPAIEKTRAYLMTGPLAVDRAVGARAINLQQGIDAFAYKQKIELTKLKNRSDFKFRNEYIDALASSEDMDRFIQFVNDYQEPDDPDGLQILNRASAKYKDIVGNVTRAANEHKDTIKRLSEYYDKDYDMDRKAFTLDATKGMLNIIKDRNTQEALKTQIDAIDKRIRVYSDSYLEKERLMKIKEGLIHKYNQIKGIQSGTLGEKYIWSQSAPVSPVR